MSNDIQDNDHLVIIDDDAAESIITLEPWQILVVDDDEEVHAATRLALARTSILGRPLALTHTARASPRPSGLPPRPPQRLSLDAGGIKPW